jgi:hypothetical protein
MIREASIWDAHKIVPLWVKMNEELGLPFIRLDEREQERFYLTLITLIAREDAFVAVSDIGHVNGFVYGQMTFLDYGLSEPVAKCEGMYIEPRGEGMEFVKAFEDWAEACGTRHIMFESIYQERLAKIWGRRGYKTVQIVYHRED